MGDGFVLFPENGQVCSPINAVVKFIFPTRHAIGLVREDGVEMLIHMGINTVSLNGAPFEIFVEEGQNVQAGQPLARMDLQQIRQTGCSEKSAACLLPRQLRWTAQGAVIRPSQSLR
ncbi:MAG: PTS glucose transporter subunit IIA [Holdemania massiliensis]